MNGKVSWVMGALAAALVTAIAAVLGIHTAALFALGDRVDVVVDRETDRYVEIKDELVMIKERLFLAGLPVYGTPIPPPKFTHRPGM